MDINEWLGQWEQSDCPGRHQRLEPALFAHGYQYKPAGRVHTMWDCVNRAIPVDGTVTDPGPSWERSPQVLHWLGKPKASVWERIVAWLNKE